MPRSQAAKELAAAQKAKIRAEKERKRNSDDPRDWGRTRQIRAVFDETRKYDPKLMPIAALCFFGPLLAFIVLGLVLMLAFNWHWFNLILCILLGVMTGILVLLQVLQSRAKNAQFTKYEGQAGSSELALQMLGKGWTSKPGVAFTKQQDMVHRAIGPNGVVLVGEGEPSRVRTLLNQEAKRTEQVLYGVKPVTVIVGEGDGLVPLRQLTKHIEKLPKSMEPGQIDQAARRLDALDRQRGRMPIPKGPMPTSVSRRAMRGR